MKEKKTKYEPRNGDVVVFTFPRYGSKELYLWQNDPEESSRNVISMSGHNCWIDSINVSKAEGFLVELYFTALKNMNPKIYDRYKRYDTSSEQCMKVMNTNLRQGTLVKINKPGEYNGYFGKVIQNFPDDKVALLEVSMTAYDGKSTVVRQVLVRYTEMDPYINVGLCADDELPEFMTDGSTPDHGPRKENKQQDTHYHKCKIEPIDYILANGLGFCEGNVVKYITRYKDKGEPLNDLRKIKVYVDYLISDLEKQESDGTDDQYKEETDAV